MKFRLEWKHKLKSNEKISCSTEWVQGETAIVMGEELEAGGKCSELYFYDEKGVTWNLREVKKLLTEIEEEPHEVTVYFDGGFIKDSAQAGLGVVIYFQQGKKKYRLRANKLFFEIETNNEAEYAAFHYALNLLDELGVRHLPCEFKGDAQGLLKQLEGEWPCYEDVLNRWLDRIEEKIKVLDLNPTFTVIPRKDNKEADKLANQALEGKEIFSKMLLL
ncbi:reverse transcriptase-like protein [Bacillus rubiinfantis]|uniref:reverse transcriptase-like protein n=1 Tax=Bacillus rubiinfantis TaxID=1499680 RepID=UPI0005A9A756|nr:reverse transcriptase-like protein [Bacillus rubiinfantis]